MSDEQTQNENGKKEAQQIGLYVFVLLLVLTAGEFMIAVIGAPWWAILIAIAVGKAWFIVQNYMHLPRLFEAQEVKE